MVYPHGLVTMLLSTTISRLAYTFQDNVVILSNAYASACNELLIPQCVVTRRMHNANPIYMKRKVGSVGWLRTLIPRTP